MKKVLLAGLLAILATAANAAEIAWVKGYSAAKAQAKQSGKLIMIDFYTDWCGWCKKLDAETYPDPAVVKAARSFISVKLDAEKDQEGMRLAKKFGIDGYPTILFLDADERLAYKIVGYEPAKEFAVSLGTAASIRGNIAKFEAALKKDPNDFDALSGLATLYASTGDMARAISVGARAEKRAVKSQRGKLLDLENAIGDGYQNDNQYAEAIEYFKKAIDPKFATQTAYARISIAACYFGLQQPKAAIPCLQDLLKMGKEADAYREQAKQMLSVAQRG